MPPTSPQLAACASPGPRGPAHPPAIDRAGAVRRQRARLARVALGITGLLLLLASSGCSIRRMAIKGMARTVASNVDVFGSDDDPELIREATPFALKTIESLLIEVPDHRGLLLAACQGFTQYAYAFVQLDADVVEDTDYEAAARLRERALKLYLRGREYGLRALELDHPGIREQFLTQPAAALADTRKKEVPLLYWTGAAWGAAIALGKDRPDLVADLPVVLALLQRALALDEAFGEGAIHDVLITLEALPANMGGSLERARQHFKRSLELSGGRKAGTFVAMAENVSVANQDRREFEDLLARALQVDPDAEPASRLQNLILQQRARHLLARVDDLFLDTAIDSTGENLP